jgi:hypothetical protein
MRGLCVAHRPPRLLPAARCPAGVQFKEVRADSVKWVDPTQKEANAGVRNALGSDYIQQLRGAAKPHEGTKMARRKHQIGTLFANVGGRQRLLQGCCMGAFALACPSPPRVPLLLAGFAAAPAADPPACLSPARCSACACRPSCRRSSCWRARPRA